jgi:hypothetical protein
MPPQWLQKMSPSSRQEWQHWELDESEHAEK